MDCPATGEGPQEREITKSYRVEKNGREGEEGALDQP
jgi:hypothetical protein